MASTECSCTQWRAQHCVRPCPQRRHADQSANGCQCVRKQCAERARECASVPSRRTVERRHNAEWAGTGCGSARNQRASAKSKFLVSVPTCLIHL